MFLLMWHCFSAVSTVADKIMPLVTLPPGQSFPCKYTVTRNQRHAWQGKSAPSLPFTHEVAAATCQGELWSTDDNTIVQRRAPLRTNITNLTLTTVLCNVTLPALHTCAVNRLLRTKGVTKWVTLPARRKRELSHLAPSLNPDQKVLRSVAPYLDAFAAQFSTPSLAASDSGTFRVGFWSYVAVGTPGWADSRCRAVCLSDVTDRHFAAGLAQTLHSPW